jgi:hypothetical protein
VDAVDSAGGLAAALRAKNFLTSRFLSQNRRAQRNNPRMGTQPRRNLDARSPNEAAHDYNQPKPTGKPAALTANNSIATTDAKRNPRKSTRKKYEFTPGTK